MFYLSVIPRLIIIILQILFLAPDNVKGGDGGLFKEMKLNVSSLGSQMREMIEHFKNSDPVGLPGAPIPDPMDTPDTKYNNFPTTLYLKRSKIHGLSQFRIEQIQLNLYSLQVEMLLTYQKLEILGNYTASSLFSGKSQGGYNVTLVDVSMGGTIKLDTTVEGHLEASHVDMDLVFSGIKMDFENPSLIINLLQGMMNAIGAFVFNQIKPYVLGQVNANIKSNMNLVLSSMKNTFPNSISPLDLAVAKGRKLVRDEGLDPYPLDDYTYSTGILSFHVRQISLAGLGSFYRVGNMTVLVRRNTVSVDAHVSTQLLEGKCSWEASFAGILSTYGTTSFSVQYVQVRTRFNQSLDLRNTPTLEDLDITLGNIQLRMDGAGTLDYVLELLVNVLPNILRRELVAGLEGVLERRIQTILSSLDIEDLVIRHVVTQLDPTSNQPQDLAVVEDESAFDFSEEDAFNLQDLYQEIDE